MADRVDIGTTRQQKVRTPRAGRHWAGPDLATIIGLGGALSLIAIAIALGGSWLAFVDLPALLIVIGGTFLVTTISFSLADIARTQRVVVKSLRHTVPDAKQTAIQLLQLARRARKRGHLSLQGTLAELNDQPFLKRALSLMIDGSPGDEVERAMRYEIYATAARHADGSAVLRRAAEVAPAMGLIGTLVGLVQMLANLDDPASIGPGMAVALLTTFYGAILANMVFAPLASKLERQSAQEALVNEICAMAVGSIGRRENPRQLEVMLNTVLPPAGRVSFFKS